LTRTVAKMSGTGSTQVAPEHPRLTYFDGMRGVAISVIVFSHLLSGWLPSLAAGAQDDRVPYLSALSHTPLSVFWAGDTAVMVLFIHSGFVLANRGLATGNLQALAAQTVKRGVRLGLPVAAAVLLTGTLVQLNAMHNIAAARVSGSDWLGSFYLPGSRPGLLWSAFGGSMLRGSAWWMGPLWSINVQFFGSLLVFALVALFGHDRRRHVIFAGVITWALAAGSLRFGVHFAALTVGIWLASWHQSSVRRRTVNLSARRWALRIAAVLVVVYFGAWPDEAVVGPWYATVAGHLDFMDSVLRPRAIAHTLAAFGAVWLVLTVGFLQRLLERQTLQTLGKYSFSIYLIHWPIQMSIGSWTFAQVAPRTHSLYFGGAVASVATIVLTGASAWLFFHLVDQPSIAISKRLATWWSSSAQDLAPVRPASALVPVIVPVFYEFPSTAKVSTQRTRDR
jgi:peptidoglycan/LPS O-acetylase OafA/YrhL